METVLIWLGSGFAFGVGVFVGAWLMHNAGGDKTRTNNMLELMAKSNALLNTRNEIGIRQADALACIAQSLEARKS